jgi:hypothetical protein
MSTPADLAQQKLFAPSLQHNAALNNVRFVSACFAGAAAGTLGLTNWAGPLLFLFSTVLTTGNIFAINCKGRPAAYMQGGLRELAMPAQENLAAFVMVWTLFYGALACCHLEPILITFLLAQALYMVR